MNISATKVIDALGGTFAVARIFDIRPPSVSDWKRDGIPRARVMYLKAAYRKALVGIDLAEATAPLRSRADVHVQGRPLDSAKSCWLFLFLGFWPAFISMQPVSFPAAQPATSINGTFGYAHSRCNQFDGAPCQGRHSCSGLAHWQARRNLAQGDQRQGSEIQAGCDYCSDDLGLLHGGGLASLRCLRPGSRSGWR